MKKLVLCFGLLGGFIGLVAGCAELKEFGRGAADGGARVGREAAHERVTNDPRIPEEMRPIADALVDAIGDAVPKPEPENPVEKTIWYSIGALLAYIAGSIGKAYVREKMNKKA